MKKLVIFILFAAAMISPFTEAQGSAATKFQSRVDYFTVFPKPPRLVKKMSFEYDAHTALKEKIRYQVNYFASLQHIPYVWGGGQFENVNLSSCQKCKACINSRKVPVKEQYIKCSACRNCGIDCSHLVVSLYNKSGLNVPYGSTGEFNRFSEDILSKYYSLIDIGNDLSLATTGDLILYDSHIVLLVENHGQGRGDILHAQDLSSIGEVGGIMFQKRKNLTSISGQPIRKILRHKRMNATLKKPIDPSIEYGLDYLMAGDFSAEF